MNYLGRLENSVTNFETEISKLAKIGKLIQDTNTLINEIAAEKELLKKSLSQLENLQTQINNESKTLAQFTETETAARQKLFSDVQSQLENVQMQVAKNSAKINQLLETQKNSLINIESIILKHDFELYNHVAEIISSKIDVARENIETKLNLRLNNFSQDISNLKKMKSEITGVAEEVKPLQEILSTIRYIKVAVSLALGTGIAACAFNFIK